MTSAEHAPDKSEPETAAEHVVETVTEAVSAAVEPSPTVEVQEQKRLARDYRHKFTPDDGQPIIGLSGRINQRYVMLRDVTYKHTTFELIVIPQGFVLDLASIPKALWLVPGLDPVDPRWRSAIVHDWMYFQQETERSVCDILFRSGVIQDGVNPFVAWCAWLLVRLFGWVRWRAVEKQWEAEQEAKEKQ